VRSGPIVATVLLASSTASAEPRESRVDVSAFAVPWGMAYTRCAVGGSAAYVAPLSQDPGALWNTTEARVGVRDVYGWVNNELGAFAEITPVAVFKLRGEVGWGAFIKPPVNGGFRTLTEYGRQLLDEGKVGRNGGDTLDWSRDGGVDNRAHFNEPIGAHGLRARLIPTFQVQVGPLIGVYTFTLDYADFRGPGRSADDVFHDTSAFTLRKVRDVLLMHEGLLAWQWTGVRDEVIVGAQVRQYRATSTGLDSLGVFGLVLVQRDGKLVRKSFAPFALAQAGSYLRDPMHRGDLSWVLVVGADWKGL